MGDSRTEKLVFPNDSGQELAGRLELPVGRPRAWAVFAHCFTCGKDFPAASRLARGLAGRGIAVLRFDFTGLGSSDGDFANTDFSSNVRDLVAAAKYLGVHHGTPKLLVGHSLGGAAVLAAARQLDEVDAVATINAPSDPGHVRGLLAGSVDEIEERGEAEVDIAGRRFRIRRDFLEDLEEQSLGRALGALRQALLVMHAPLDEVVAIEHAERIYKAARGFRSFVSLAEADHLLSKRRDADYAAEVLAAWVERYLPERSGADEDGPAEGEVVVREVERPYTNRVRARSHEALADEPRQAGGLDAGMNPYEYLLAGLGACTSMTLRMYAERKGWPLERVAVRLRHSRIHAEDCADCETEQGQVDRIERSLEITGAELDDEQRARLLEIADRCPVHRTLNSETRIETRASE